MDEFGISGFYVYAHCDEQSYRDARIGISSYPEAVQVIITPLPPFAKHQLALQYLPHRPVLSSNFSNLNLRIRIIRRVSHQILPKCRFQATFLPLLRIWKWTAPSA